MSKYSNIQIKRIFCVAAVQVDSGAVEESKMRALQGMPLSAASRSFLKADLGDPAGQEGAETSEGCGHRASLPSLLLAGSSGFKAGVPAVWLLEGLIGYLSKQQGSNLLKAGLGPGFI